MSTIGALEMHAAVHGPKPVAAAAVTEKFPVPAALRQILTAGLFRGKAFFKRAQGPGKSAPKRICMALAHVTISLSHRDNHDLTGLKQRGMVEQNHTIYALPYSRNDELEMDMTIRKAG